jgi:hypothetical protein
MTHKYSLAIPKPWPYMGSLALHIHEITAKLRDIKKIEIPTGYQDETGFHLGVKPAEKKVKWPPEW